MKKNPEGVAETGMTELIDKASLAQQKDKSDRYAEIWDSLLETDREIALMLPLIPDSPAGSAVDSWLRGFPEITDAQARETLTKLQAQGIVAFDKNWVWVIDSDFIEYLTVEVVKWGPPAVLNVEQIRVDNSEMGYFLMGKAVVFILVDDKWVRHDVQLYRNIKEQEPLREFEYRKPLVSDQFFEEPTEFESSARTGYYPLAIAEGVRRPPNHLYRDDDMLVAAANFGTEEEPDWQIRCFPKSCIPELTWSEAEQKLK